MHWHGPIPLLQLASVTKFANMKPTRFGIFLCVSMGLALTPFEQIGIPPPLQLEPPTNYSQDAKPQLDARELLSSRQSSCYYPNGWCSSQSEYHGFIRLLTDS